MAERIDPSTVLENGDINAIAERISSAAQLSDGEEPTCVIASVNSRVSAELGRLLGASGVRVLSFGKDLALPIANTLDDASTVGQDRLLDAIGAFARSKQACVVIDAGTAITVDFVDGEGIFHGGAIAPGIRMMLRAMHDQTSALPKVELTQEMLDKFRVAASGTDEGGESASASPFGKDTVSAMTLGAMSAARGLVHELVDRYAEFYEAYPRVVATGGDAPLLFEHDPLVESIVPDLTLIGMFEAIRLIEQLDEAEDDAEGV
jgi:type III pantothenate kinase